MADFLPITKLELCATTKFDAGHLSAFELDAAAVQWHERTKLESFSDRSRQLLYRFVWLLLAHKLRVKHNFPDDVLLENLKGLRKKNGNSALLKLFPQVSGPKRSRLEDALVFPVSKRPFVFRFNDQVLPRDVITVKLRYDVDEAYREATQDELLAILKRLNPIEGNVCAPGTVIDIVASRSLTRGENWRSEPENSAVCSPGEFELILSPSPSIAVPASSRDLSLWHGRPENGPHRWGALITVPIAAFRGQTVDRARETETIRSNRAAIVWTASGLFALAVLCVVLIQTSKRLGDESTNTSYSARKPVINRPETTGAAVEERLANESPMEELPRSEPAYVDAESPGSWVALGDAYQIESQGRDKEEILFLGSEQLSDFDFEVTATSPHGGALGVVFRASDEGDFLFWSCGFRVGPEDRPDLSKQGAELGKRQGGRYTLLTDAQGSFVLYEIPAPSSASSIIKVSVRGDKCDCWIDNVKICTADLPSEFPSGRVGFFFMSPNAATCDFSKIKLVDPNGNDLMPELPTEIVYDATPENTSSSP